MYLFPFTLWHPREAIPWPGLQARSGEWLCSSLCVWGDPVKAFAELLAAGGKIPLNRLPWLFPGRHLAFVLRKASQDQKLVSLSVANISFSSTSPMGVQDSEAERKRCTSK